MIWFILGAAPFVIGLVYLLYTDFWFFARSIVITVIMLGLLLLNAYGAWQMGWFEHCGDFWESFSCS